MTFARVGVRPGLLAERPFVGRERGPSSSP